ncbi:MAG: SpoIIE family protein phosphatase [Bdellovibrionaceae bacterium]|nr:SpoIIE family protein phosphatase [Pseudobdellovibrionaceae bacterium]
MNKLITVRNKIFSLFVVVLLGAIASYMFYAISLFTKDKEAYVFENKQLLLENISSELKVALNKRKNIVSELHNQLHHKKKNQVSQALASEKMNNSGLVYYKFYKMNKSIFSYSLAEFLEINDLSKNYFLQNYKDENQLFVSLKNNDFEYLNRSKKGAPPLIGIIYKNNDSVSVSYFKAQPFFELVSKSKDYKVFVSDSRKNILLHSELKFMYEQNSKVDHDLFTKFNLENLKRQTGEYKNKKGESSLVSQFKIEEDGLQIFSQISTKNAFSAAKVLVNKTLLFSIFLISIMTVTALVFANGFTKPIDALYMATQEVAKGNFSIQVKVSSKDEVGALARSFNWMIQEIQKLLKETHQKALLEKELETAKLVQESLFPEVNFESEIVKMSSFTEPATQCGGDWWGYQQVDNDLYVLIGDATGHGVPSALITAAAQSSFTTQVNSAIENNYKIDTAQLMTGLNRAIYSASKGRIKMTFFIAKINLISGGCEYTNASHDVPFISMSPKETNKDALRSRDNLESLSGFSDPVLGAEFNSTYEKHYYQLNPNDVLFFYTDGITEGANVNHEEWGESRLLRSLVKVSHEDVSEICDTIVKKAYKFFGETERTDDITVVVVKYYGNEVSAHIKEAS